MMTRTRVVEWVDISAPCEDVYRLVLDLQRRLQLSPLWDFTRIKSVSQDYPNEGSRFFTRLVKQPEQDTYTTTITAHNPRRKFGYELNIDRQTNVIWRFIDVADGTRLIYEEEFFKKEADGDDFAQNVRTVARQWLKNIKNYAELREGRLHRLVRWFLDRFYLKLRRDQRQAVATILFMHAIGIISFLIAALALGVAFYLN